MGIQSNPMSPWMLSQANHKNIFMDTEQDKQKFIGDKRCDKYSWLCVGQNVEMLMLMVDWKYQHSTESATDLL